MKKLLAALSLLPLLCWAQDYRATLTGQITDQSHAPVPQATVKAVKQANDDLHQARRIVEDAGLALYAGDDNLVFPFLELGGVGGICVHSHVCGPQVKEMIELEVESDAQHVAGNRFEQIRGPRAEIKDRTRVRESARWPSFR